MTCDNFYMPLPYKHKQCYEKCSYAILRLVVFLSLPPCYTGVLYGKSRARLYRHRNNLQLECNTEVDPEMNLKHTARVIQYMHKHNFLLFWDSLYKENAVLSWEGAVWLIGYLWAHFPQPLRAYLSRIGEEKKATSSHTILSDLTAIAQKFNTSAAWKVSGMFILTCRF